MSHDRKAPGLPAGHSIVNEAFLGSAGILPLPCMFAALSETICQLTGLRQQVVQFMSGVLHLLVEGTNLSLAACMERSKPHSSQCLLIREVWLDDAKRSSLSRLDPV